MLILKVLWNSLPVKLHQLNSIDFRFDKNVLFAHPWLSRQKKNLPIPLHPTWILMVSYFCIQDTDVIKTFIHKVTSFSKWATRPINKRRLLQNHLENHNAFHQFLLFYTWIRVQQCSSWRQLQFGNEVQERIFTWLHIINKGPCAMRPQKRIWSRFWYYWSFVQGEESHHHHFNQRNTL